MTNSTKCNAPTTPPPASDDPLLRTVWTIPNAICVGRMIGSLLLIPLAWEERPFRFLMLYLALAVTDWLDGKLAVLLHQRSVLGPVLDSVSDVTLYSCVLYGCLWMKPAFLRSEAVWVLAAVISYVVSVVISLVRFHRFPSYHTWGAKLSWLLVVGAVVAMFADWSAWPFRLAMTVVAFTNLETALLSLLLDERRSDIPSLYHAWRSRQSANRPGGPHSDSTPHGP